MRELKGCLVSIDAMGCQNDITQNIVDKGADYLLAVKASKEKLHDAVHSIFIRHLLSQPESQRVIEQSRGRIEYQVLDSRLLPEQLSSQWCDIKAVSLAVSYLMVK